MEMLAVISFARLVTHNELSHVSNKGFD